SRRTRASGWLPDISVLGPRKRGSAIPQGTTCAAPLAGAAHTATAGDRAAPGGGKSPPAGAGGTTSGAARRGGGGRGGGAGVGGGGGWAGRAGAGSCAGSGRCGWTRPTGSRPTSGWSCGPSERAGDSMGSVFKKTYTKPVPPGADVITRQGRRFARWKDRKG